MEFLMSLDSVVCLITGGILGGLSGQVMKGFGMIGNVAVGLIGRLIGGIAFDSLDIIDVGDIADPVIAGVVGAVILLGIVWVARRNA